MRVLITSGILIGCLLIITSCGVITSKELVKATATCDKLGKDWFILFTGRNHEVVCKSTSVKINIIVEDV